MIIPTIKTLVTYISRTETRKVLCDIAMGDDKYASIEYEHGILARCPFLDGNYHEEIYSKGNNVYEIVYYDYQEPIDRIDVIVESVLEFNGRVFTLEETQFDTKEYED